MQYCVSQPRKWVVSSQSRRLTCFSRTLEENCIIHIVDWSLFCTLGWKVGRKWRKCSGVHGHTSWQSCIYKYKLLIPELTCHSSLSRNSDIVVTRFIRLKWAISRPKITNRRSTHKCLIDEPRDAHQWASVPFSRLLLSNYSAQDHSSRDPAC